MKYKHKLRKLEEAVEEKDPDIFLMNNIYDYRTFKSIKKHEPKRRMVIKVARNFMLFINEPGREFP